MRAAAFFAASLVLMGAWIVLAAAFAFSTSTIAIGLVTIAVVAAVTHLATAPVAGSRPSTSARSSALNAAE